MSASQINPKNLQELLQAKVLEVLNEPAYNWNSPFNSYMTDEQDQPVIRLGIINFDLETDIWAGLRSPALIGMHPVTPEDIWRHYAVLSSKTVRADGSPNPLAMPEPYEDAKSRYGRGVIVCGFLAVNPEVHRLYAEKVACGDEDPFDYYTRATEDVNRIIDKAIGKVGMALMAPKRAVVAMTDRNVKMVIDRTRGEYYSGRYHGPCNDHWPNNSLAVMTGVLRFGVNRIAFRDEATENGRRQRLFGRYRSIVIFDENLPIADEAGGVTLLDANRLAELKRINDYSLTDEDVISQRYCTYNRTNGGGESICGKCLEACPSGALANSTPSPIGIFDELILQQKQRFSDGVLDFDFANCTNDRHKKALLYEDYVCARCEVVCAAEGVRKSSRDLMQINGVA